MSPGRWTIRSSSEPGALDIWTKNGRNITVRGARKEDNARLVAAAPDLLAALQSITRFLGDFHEARHTDSYEHVLDPARAAIAKATEGGV